MGSDFSELSVGKAKPFATVDSMRVDYSLASLWQKKVSRISLSGVEFILHFQNGQLAVPWQSDQKASNDKIDSGNSPNYSLDYFINLGEINIDRAVVNFFSDNHYFSIPCSITAQIEPTNPRLIVVDAELTLRDQNIMVSAIIDLETLDVRTDIEVTSLNLVRFADLIKVNNDFTASGIVAITAKAHLVLKPFRILSAEVLAKLEQTDITFSQMRISNIKSQDEQSFLFGLTADKDQVRLTSTFLAVAGGIEAKVGGINLLLSKSESGFVFDGEFSVNILEQKDGASFFMMPLELVTALHGRTGKGDGWQFQATSSNEKIPLVI